MKINFFNSTPYRFHTVMLFYRVLVAASLFTVHGLKKIHSFDTDLNSFPDPLGFGSTFTFCVAIGSTLVCPLLIMAGLLTRVACLGVLATTLSGLFLVHLHDSVEIMDTPYIYSLSMLIILFLGPGKYSFDYTIENRA